MSRTIHAPECECAGSAADGATKLFAFTAIAVCFLVLFTCLYFGAVVLIRVFRRPRPDTTQPAEWLQNLDHISQLSGQINAEHSIAETADADGSQVVLVVLPDDTVHLGVVHTDKELPDAADADQRKGSVPQDPGGDPLG